MVKQTLHLLQLVFVIGKKGEEKVQDHENSVEHRNAIYACLIRQNISSRVDKELSKQITTESEYWREVLKRTVAAVKFLSSRGLAFRGENEKFGVSNNGNYLGILELIAEFDPFLKEHINTHGNKGKGNTSYLSTTVCEELINLMG